MTITSTSPTEVTSNDGMVKFVGQYSPYSITEDNKDEILFVGSGNQIGYVSSTATLPRLLKNFRAHFWVQPNGMPEEPAQGARTINIDWGDSEASGITTTDLTNDKNSDGAWYDLSGRRLSGKPTQHGIYINGGQKIIVK